MKHTLKMMAVSAVMTGLFATTASAFENQVEPFERLNSRLKTMCSGSRTTLDGYDILEINDCTSKDRYPGGLSIRDRAGHPYLGHVVSKYPDGSKPTRKIEILSYDHAFNGTYLYLEDIAGGPDSHDVKSVTLLLPRLGIPSIQIEGEEAVVTLTTGETVSFDKTTYGINSGALKEGPIDLTTDRFKRQAPNVHYTGKGISIRVDHRYEFPTQGAVKAEVRQGSRVCKISKTLIWNAEGVLTVNDDKSIVDILNKKCVKKPGENAFQI